jgi:hypothetical protein
MSGSGQGFPPFPTRAEALKVLKIFWTNTGMVKHLNQARFKSRNGAQECGSVHTHTHTHLKAELHEQIFFFLGETERFNGPKIIVSLFDEIRCVSKASGIKS